MAQRIDVLVRPTPSGSDVYLYREGSRWQDVTLRPGFNSADVGVYPGLSIVAPAAAEAPPSGLTITAVPCSATFSHPPASLSVGLVSSAPLFTASAAAPIISSVLTTTSLLALFATPESNLAIADSSQNPVFFGRRRRI